MKKALITGINGQDGSYLAEHLLGLGYEVHGILKRNSVAENQTARLNSIFSQVKLYYADMTDIASLFKVINKVQPDEIYNLAAQSHVRISFDQPLYTANATGMGVLNLLEVVSEINPKIKIYQASSSEMFGRVSESPQNEETPFNPISPYGIAKTFAHNTCRSYREMYGIRVSCGILFNHEGEFRGHEFVTRKITSNVARIALGYQKTFSLGNLDARRDWGYAGDYVEAMWKMMKSDKPGDYVIATGETHSVSEFLLTALEVAGLEKNVEKYVTFDPQMKRPQETNLLVGDASKAHKELGWRPEKSLFDLILLMVENDLSVERA